jgi:hypothetical protein
VNGNIDAAVKQCVFQFFSEDAFTSDHREWVGLNVSRGFDYLDADFEAGIKFFEESFGLL